MRHNYSLCVLRWCFCRLLLVCLLIITASDGAISADEISEKPREVAAIRKPSPPYCGLYCLYAMMRLAGSQPDFRALVKPEYIGSRKGSTLTELRTAAEDQGLRAEPIRRLTGRMLQSCPCPIILQVKRQVGDDQYDHYELFLGMVNGQARLLDPPNSLRLVSFRELTPRWSGSGLIVSAGSIDFGHVLASDRKRFVVSTAAVVVALICLHLAKQCLPTDMFKSPRAIFGLSLAQGMGLAVLTLLGALLCHLFCDAGLLANASATEAIQQAHAGDFIPRIKESGVRSRMGNGTVLVDARFARDYKAGHMDGAISIPVDANDAVRRQITSKVDKASKVVVYCQSKGCPFAEKVAVRLVEDGFTDVSIYRGGWMDWISKNGKPKEGKS